MFNLDRFIEECKAAVARDSSHRSVREILKRAVSEPSSLIGRLGEPQRAEAQKLYQSPTLTILNVVWGPHMTFLPLTFKPADGEDRKTKTAGSPQRFLNFKSNCV